MPRGRLKRELEHELVRILFDGRLRLLRLGFLPGSSDSNGRRGCVAAAPEEIAASPEEHKFKNWGKYINQ
jgi:hypothetical protein